MSALSDHTAVRRELIATILLTLSDLECLSTLVDDEFDLVSERVADALIDTEWVVGAPEAKE